MPTNKHLKDRARFLMWLLIIAILVCAVALYFRVFAEMELPSRIFASILGVILTAIITLLLLNEQGKAQNELQKDLLGRQTEEQKSLKRSEKVFGEKLRIYQDFIDCLYKAVNDGELTEQEKLELQFKTSLVAMHCKPENIARLSVAVRRVIEGACPQGKSQTDANNPYLLKNLFDVVEAFRKDLYESDFVPFGEDVKSTTIENFKSAYDNAQPGTDECSPKRNVIDVNILSAPSTVEQKQNSDVAEVAVGVGEKKQMELWNNQVKVWETQGWNAVWQDRNEGKCLIVGRGDDFPLWIDIEYWHRHYVLNAHSDDRNFSQALKWEFGGRRYYGDWYENLPQPFTDIRQGQFYKVFESNLELQKYIVDRVTQLQPILLAQHHTEQRKAALGNIDGWNVWIWYWKALVCERLLGDGKKISLRIFDTEDNPENVVVYADIAGLNKEQTVQMLKGIGFAEDPNIQQKCDNGNGVPVIVANEKELGEKVSVLTSDIENYINQSKFKSYVKSI